MTNHPQRSKRLATLAKCVQTALAALPRNHIQAVVLKSGKALIVTRDANLRDCAVGSLKCAGLIVTIGPARMNPAVHKIEARLPPA